ncbi:MAG: hypothetical protein QUU85_08840, partial [Candidatus Eisenbacteria bacterium]|nr:hypothetical protein [Candidatus Eisenbacteria bacterium]
SSTRRHTRYTALSRGLGDVYKRQGQNRLESGQPGRRGVRVAGRRHKVRRKVGQAWQSCC